MALDLPMLFQTNQQHVPTLPASGETFGVTGDEHLVERVALPDGEDDFGDLRPSADDIEREVAIVHELRLSPDLRDWVNRYERFGQRPLYLWKWCRRGVEVTTLPCVPPEVRDELADTKVLGVMLDVLMDDVADEGGDPEFLELLLELPFGDVSGEITRFPEPQQRYAEFTATVWEEIHRRAARATRYDEFRDLLLFDYRQLLNAMRYAHLLNSDPSLLNLTEHDLYLPHNMHMMVSSTIDVMHAPGFEHRELGLLREAVSRAQYMGRIGNLTTTWERELAEGDFTSGVFAAGRSLGVLKVTDVGGGNEHQLAQAIRSGGLEAFFLRRWHDCRRDLLRLQPCLQSVDLGELVSGLDRLICLHLGSRGNK